MKHVQCGKECGYYTYQALVEAGYDPAVGGEDGPRCRACRRKLRGVMIDFVDDTEVAYS